MERTNICKECFWSSPSATGEFCNRIGFKINNLIPVADCNDFSERQQENYEDLEVNYISEKFFKNNRKY
jgi:hypothetical protein